MRRNRQDYSILFEGMTARYPAGLIHEVRTVEGTLTCTMSYRNIEISGSRQDLEQFKRELQEAGVWNPVFVRKENNTKV